MIKISLVILATLGLAAPALGQEFNNRTVATADLDLASAAGVAALDRRLDQAVRLLCDSHGETSAAAQSRSRRCRAEAAASARSQRIALLAARGRGGVRLASSRPR